MIRKIVIFKGSGGNVGLNQAKCAKCAIFRVTGT
jgi:hypothetical protein